MTTTFLTLSPGQSYEIGDPDAKFPFTVDSSGSGTVTTIPDPDPQGRAEGFIYVYTAGQKGYGEFVVNPVFGNYQLYAVTIPGGDGSTATQHAPVAQSEILHLPVGDDFVPLTALTANDSDPDGDYLFVTIVSPVHADVPAGAFAYASLTNQSGDSTPDPQGYFELGSTLLVGAENGDGSFASYAKISFDYVVSDAYGNKSAPATATIILGMPPSSGTSAIYGDTDTSPTNVSTVSDIKSGNNAILASGHADGSAYTGLQTFYGGDGNDSFLLRSKDFVASSTPDKIIYDFHGAGGYSANENDFISLTGFGSGSTLSFVRTMATGSAGDTTDIYAIHSSATGQDYSIQVHSIDGQHLVAGDYAFYG